MSRPALLLICAACACLPSPAFIRSRNSAGLLARRTDFENIRFHVNDQTAPGLLNSSGGVTITPDSDPLGAIQAAMDAWTAIPTSRVAFAPISPTSTQNSQSDRENVISFADTPANRSIVGDAIAVTRTFATASGEIIDTDILFNPNLPFSTTLQPGTFDIQTVATHELGHALGAGHSGLVSSTMFFAVRRANNSPATLTYDDIAFATDAYPEPEVLSQSGSITGSVSLSTGGPVRGALVAAVDPANGLILGSITSPDGAYTLGPLPPGRYFVYAEPADGPVEPGQLGSAGAGANTGFVTAVLGGAATPHAISVAAGGSTVANLVVEAASPPLNIRQAGAGPPDGAVPFGAGAFVLSRGASADLVLIGDGLDDPSITAESISFFGAPIAVTGVLRRGVASGSNLPTLRFNVRVSPDAPLGEACVMVRSAGGVTVYSAGIRIAPALPVFAAAGLVNAASFAGGPAAPGEIVSVFGTGLGPPAGQVGSLNPRTGRLADALAGVTVTFNGIRAPLFYVSQGQINAQVPYEMAGQSAATVVVTHRLAASQAVSIPIGLAQPGIFVQPGTSQAIAQNQDGSLNGVSNPAVRGQAISLYATGQGAVAPALPTGALAAVSPLSEAVRTVTATIGGRPAQVLFAGMAPQFVGLLQINVLVPANAPTGPSVPLTVNIGGTDSQPNVTLAIR